MSILFVLEFILGEKQTNAIIENIDDVAEQVLTALKLDKHEDASRIRYNIGVRNYEFLIRVGIIRVD